VPAKFKGGVMKYSDEFDRLLALLIKENDRLIHKGVNYTDTYTRKYLLSFIERLTSRVMYNHCIEDRVAMHEIADEYHEWLDKNADRLAKEDQDYKLEMKEATLRRQGDVDTSNDRV
jgi:hypothetical protein